MFDDTEDLAGSADSSSDRYFTVNREYGEDGWYPTVHAVAGTNLMLNDSLALVITLRYEYMEIESLEVELVSDGEDQWHWNEKKLKGDAGGFGLSFGVNYAF
jgi:hypothetical protein